MLSSKTMNRAYSLLSDRQKEKFKIIKELKEHHLNLELMNIMIKLRGEELNVTDKDN